MPASIQRYLVIALLSASLIGACVPRAPSDGALRAPEPPAQAPAAEPVVRAAPAAPPPAPAAQLQPSEPHEKKECLPDPLAGDAELLALRARACELAPLCCNNDFGSCPRHMTKHRLDGKRSLLLLECEAHSYNRENTAWLVEGDGRLAAPSFAPIEAAYAEITGVGQETPTAPLSIWSPFQKKPQETPTAPLWIWSPWFKRHLHTTFCARHFCDAGTTIRYRWTGREFQMSQVQQRDDDCCADIEDYGAWPIVWPKSAACAYRWQVRGDVVELVAITPKGDKAHRVEGLPAACTSNDRGTVLTCGEMHVPVTSQGKDWVIWLKPGGYAKRSKEAVIHWRAPRGCKL